MKLQWKYGRCPYIHPYMLRPVKQNIKWNLINFMQHTIPVTKKFQKFQECNVSDKKVTKPTGIISKNIHMDFRMHFFLDRHLTLHVTIDYIYFGYGNFHKCTIGNFTVAHYHPKLFEVSFCGIYSNFSVFPDTYMLYFKLHVIEEIHFNLLVFFTVMDAGIIRGYYPQIIGYPYKKLKWSLQFPQTGSSVHRLFINTLKHNLFLIKLLHVIKLTIEIYDGPGIKSSPLSQIENTIYKTNSFQCVVVLWNMKNAPNANISNYSTYTVTQNEVTQYIFVEHKMSQAISYKSLISKLVVYKFMTNERFAFNLTTYRLTNTVTHNTACNFAGLTAYNINNSHSTEITTICTEYKTIDQNRNIYTEGNEMFLVIYSYLEYKYFKIHATLSTTECRPVFPNTCAVKYWKNDELLDKQFMQEKRHILTQYSIEGRFTKRTLKFFPKNSMCIVLQIKHDLSSLTKWRRSYSS